MTQGFSEYGDGFIRLRAILKDMQRRTSQRATLDVGWDDRTTYPNGTPVGIVARAQEFGATINHPGGTRYARVNGRIRFIPNASKQKDIGKTGAHQIRIPARPFIRPAIADNEDRWRDFVSKQLANTDLPLDTVLEQLGLIAVGDIQNAIKAVVSPPLARSTERRRLSKPHDNAATATKPLVDTGVMLRTVRSEVTMGAASGGMDDIPAPSTPAPPTDTDAPIDTPQRGGILGRAARAVGRFVRNIFGGKR